MSLNRCVAGQLFNCSDYNEALDAIEHQDYSYVIYKDSGTYYAKNGQTGVLDYSDASFSTVLNDVYTALTDGGLIYLVEQTYEVDAPLTPSERTITRGFGVSTILEVQSDIDCIKIIGGGAADLKEHIGIEELTIKPAGGVASTNAGIYLQYVGNCTFKHLAIDEMYMGVEGIPTTNTISQCNFIDVDCYQCDYGFHLHLTFDNRFRDCLINSPQAIRTAVPFGGAGFSIIGGAGGDVIDGCMVLQGHGHGFYFENCEWLLVNDSIADDCWGHGWLLTDTSAPSFKGLQMENCWGSSNGLDVAGGGVNTWDGACGFYLENIEDPICLVNLQARTNANDGIYLDTCSNVEITTPVCMNNSKIHVGGGGLPDKHGIELHDCEYVQVVGGRCGDNDTGTQDYGIYEDNVSDNNLFSTVDVRGNTTAGIQLTGIDTQTRLCEGWNPIGNIGLVFDHVNTHIWYNGGNATPNASTDYTVGTADIKISSTDSGNTDCAIMLKDPAGNNVLQAALSTIESMYVPAGFILNWGAYTGAAPTVTVSFN